MVDIAVKTGAKVVAIVTIIRGGAEGGSYTFGRAHKGDMQHLFLC
jgi:hypothetical protein